jgi:hypothetical protein
VLFRIVKLPPPNQIAGWVLWIMLAFNTVEIFHDDDLGSNDKPACSQTQIAQTASIRLVVSKSFAFPIWNQYWVRYALV